MLEFAKVLPIILLAWKAKKKDETDKDDLESKRTKDIPLSTLNFIIPLGPLINMFCIYQLSPPIPFILSNDDDDTDKENEHLEIV
nr:5792_t:CDS:2 [Entrophospora candida]